MLLPKRSLKSLLIRIAPLAIGGCFGPNPEANGGGETEGQDTEGTGSTTGAGAGADEGQTGADGEGGTSGQSTATSGTSGGSSVGATDDDFFREQDSRPLTVGADEGLLANDTASEGASLSVVSGSYDTSAGGVAVVADDGSFSYEPPVAEFWGPDSFEYVATDGGGNESKAVASVFSRPDVVSLELVTNGFSGWSIVTPNGISAINVASGAGDPNDDGRDDVLVATESDNAYLVFGKADTDAVLLDAIVPNGLGYEFEGLPGSLAPVARGLAGGVDVNGDGRHDLLVGAPEGHYSTELCSEDSATLPVAYAIYGRENPGVISASALERGEGGFKIEMADPSRKAGSVVDFLAASSSGNNSVLVTNSLTYFFDGLNCGVGSPFPCCSHATAYTIDPSSGATTISIGPGNSGASSEIEGILFGGDGSARGAAFEDEGARSAGDFDGDGADDVMYPEHGMDLDPHAFIRLSGGGEVRINTEAFNGLTSYMFLRGGGDFDGDQHDDVLVFHEAAERAYIVKGGQAPSSTVQLTDVPAPDGPSFVLASGVEVVDAALGDINGDGYADAAIVASGEVTIRYGGPSYSSSATGPNSGFTILGEGSREISGVSLGADVNGDGVGDAVVLAYDAATAFGRAYVVFGTRTE